MSIEYRENEAISAEELAALFERSGIRRPFDDIDRVQRMIDHANLTICAWDGDRLVGVARSLTDFVWCCYLSDLAVDLDYQHRGIGRELVAQVRAAIGDRTTLILVAAPEAVDYYPKLGFEPIPSAWTIPRLR